METEQDKLYNILLSNGRVIDPETYLDGQMHVGIKGDRIMALVEQGLQEGGLGIGFVYGYAPGAGP